jgi:EAL domain-containing protein (putative c-di-GMP-specific phosphodiesterase class I)/GGDEF domain-containing protein
MAFQEQGRDLQDRTPFDAIGWLLANSRALLGRRGLLLLPAVALLAYLGGGDTALLIAAVGLPLCAAIAGSLLQKRDRAEPGARDAGALRQHLATHLDAGLRDAGRTGKSTACLVLRLDQAARLRDLHGAAAEAEVLARCADRLCAALRDGDLVIRLPEAGFAVGLRSGRRLDLETLIQLSARLQAALNTAINLNAMPQYVTYSVGFCLGQRSPSPTGEALLLAADMAARDALLHGPAAIRAFTPDIALLQADQMALRETLEMALEDGQIRPHFQPQVSTETGTISGFEALARWYHPERGIIGPAEFLPMIDDLGLAERLAEVMLFHSMMALNAWDRAGLMVRSVGVNFSTADLRNPRLAEKLKWELDRFDLTPNRLSIEILETVVADTDNDISVRNIAALANMGCGIDLDDFGTGNASIGSIRRFTVRRIKIDRSFVTHVDDDPTQQRMISALISLADQLGLDTLAEGVETGAEHAMLAQLGCRHVQGFGIARPMPFEDTIPWIVGHLSLQTAPPKIGKRAILP